MRCFLIDESDIGNCSTGNCFNNHKNCEYEMIKMFTSDKTIDGDKLQEYFFETEKKYDVFISHFSQEKDKAMQLKNFLEENCKVKAFVDSDVWGNYREILSYIEEEFEAGNKEYLLANLHIMLQSSLRKMIESAKYFIFIDSITHCENNIIYSPWVYYELQEAYEKIYYKTQLSMENFTESLDMSIKRDISRFTDIFQKVEDINFFKKTIK